MTGNRLIERRATAKADANAEAHCPDGYASAYAWCAWRNREKTRTDVMWVVGPNGIPILVDDEGVCGRLARETASRLDDERRKFNHRLMHPITEEGRAA